MTTNTNKLALPKTDENIIQQNTIELLKSMCWTYISREDNAILRDNRLQIDV